MRWTVDGLTATQAYSAIRPIAGINGFQINPGETVEQAFARTYHWVNIPTALQEVTLPPGGFFPRMVRPFDESPDDRPGGFPKAGLYTAEIAGTSGQLISLVGRLQSICQVVEPTGSNLKAYGHATRECLMIAAMEVESHWKAILRANGAPHDSTNDYVKVLPAMRLDDYEIAFSRYPSLSAVRPFQGWNKAKPTQSLPFYSAYHDVKHDRESKFDQGTLDLALHAVAGCAVLAAAQFGWDDVFGRNRGLEEFFALTATPKWGMGDHYASEANGWPPSETQFPF